MLLRSTSSSFTAALLAISIAALARSVSLVAASKASAILKHIAARVLGSGRFWSGAAGALYTRAARLTKILSARSTNGSFAAGAAGVFLAGGGAGGGGRGGG